MHRFVYLGIVLSFAFTLLGSAVAGEPPEGAKHIGGRWVVIEGKVLVYYYQDGQQYVDLFSYHRRDSNKDGIDNIRLSHDDQFLIMQSVDLCLRANLVGHRSGHTKLLRSSGKKTG